MKNAVISTLICTAILTACSNPDAKEHEYVDLGLSVKWATVNIGASSPEDCGDYFAWGEVKHKGSTEEYTEEDYKWREKGALTKYNFKHKLGMVDNKYELDMTDDAAHENWGGSWRVPTSEEIKELVDRCTWEDTSINGRRGYKVTGPSGNSIFLPAAGSPWGRNFIGGYYDNILLDELGYYWSKSLYKDDEGWNCFEANALFFSVEEHESDDILYQRKKEVKLIRHFRGAGFSIRPVCP